jgi:isocitrate dehydrogenase
MGEWSMASRTHVAHMRQGDFYAGEKSMTLDRARDVKMELVTKSGETIVLKPKVSLDDGDVIDSMFMSKQALCEFYEAQMEDAYKTGVMFSLHVKATMMKVSHPIVFGHAVKVFYKDAFAKHQKLFDELGVNVNNGLVDLYSKIESLPASQRDEVIQDLHACHEHRPELAMVDSARGISNFHSPSDVIVDASMPAMIRTSGHMWGPDGQEADTLAVIPDSSYAWVYQTVLDDCRAHGAFDPTTMGSVPNVGLMAQAAEEYGSHDKTFEVPAAGTVRVVNEAGDVLIEHDVEAGDIWRACQTKDVPVRDWVKLAVTRARATGAPAIFWLDETRAHDANLIAKVREYLPEHDTDGLEIQILAPELATAYSLERIRKGEDTISVTGNVLRDYLTDLFPILELGTSAKMLSIVPLIAGGGLFETGAGGSAPKHVQQLVKENYLRWDSLGEFLALAESFGHYGRVHDNPHAIILGQTLDRATGTFLDQNRNPARKVGSIDNRGSHFYLALYWAQELAGQDDDPELAAAFAPLAQRLADDEEAITAELIAVQGHPVDLGGYYRPDDDKVTAVMRPSTTFNEALASL